MALQTKGKLLQLRISEAELSAWKQHAEEEGLSMSQLVRNAVNSECEAVAYAKELIAELPTTDLPPTLLSTPEVARPPHPATRTNQSATETDKKFVETDKCQHHGYERRPFCYRCGKRL